MSSEKFSFDKDITKPVGYVYNWCGIICGTIIVIILIAISIWLYKQLPWRLKSAIVTKDSECHMETVNTKKNNYKKRVCNTNVAISNCIGDTKVENTTLETDSDKYMKNDIINVFENPNLTSDENTFFTTEKYSYSNNGLNSHKIAGILILVALVIFASVAAQYYLRNNSNQQRLSALRLAGTAVRKII